MSEQQIARVLAELQRQRVSDDLDLWPAIAARLSAPKSVHRGFSGRLLRRTALGAVALSLLLVVTVAARLLSPGPRSASPARQVLEALAKVAAAQPAYAEAGGYRYLRTEGQSLAMAQVNGQRVSMLQAVTREMWVGPDGSGRIRQTSTPLAYYGLADPASPAAFGLTASGQTETMNFGPGGLYFEDYSQLPTDPDKLFTVVSNRATIQGGRPVNVEMLTVVGDLLREPGAPPGVRAALFKVASQVEGVELLGNMTDSAGRSGVALAITSDDLGARERHVLIFDPATSALLEEKFVLLDQGDWPVGKIPFTMDRTTVLESGLVETLP